MSTGSHRRTLITSLYQIALIRRRTKMLAIATFFYHNSSSKKRSHRQKFLKDYETHVFNYLVLFSSCFFYAGWFCSEFRSAILQLCRRKGEQSLYLFHFGVGLGVRRAQELTPTHWNRSPALMNFWKRKLSAALYDNEIMEQSLIWKRMNHSLEWKRWSGRNETWKLWRAELLQAILISLCIYLFD